MLNLEVVTFEKDRQQVFEAMRSRKLVISALARDQAQFVFELDKVERSRLFLILRPPFPRPLAPPENLTLTFGLDEGQYFVKGTVEAVSGDLYVVPVGEHLYRMQRRNNFRAPVPESMAMTFQTMMSDGTRASFSLADLSGGGMGLMATKERAATLKKGDVLRGTLMVQGRDPIELETSIRYVWPPDSEGVVRFGVKCQNLGAEKEKQLVAICLQIHRELFSIFRGYNR